MAYKSQFGLLLGSENETIREYHEDFVQKAKEADLWGGETFEQTNIVCRTIYDGKEKDPFNRHWQLGDVPDVIEGPNPYENFDPWSMNGEEKMFHNPLNRYYKGSGKKVMASMKEQYGEKKGKSVFYATAKKRG